MEWARRYLSHTPALAGGARGARRELRDSLFDFSEDSVISVAREALAHTFIHSPILPKQNIRSKIDTIPVSALINPHHSV